MPLTDDFMLPRRVRTMEQMADLLQAEEAEINQAQRTIDAMSAQLAVGTSTFLLPRHERIFGLPVDTGEGLEVRRARVLARLNTRGVTTVQAIRELVQIITGREGEVTEHFADYAFSVTVRLLFPDATKDLGELIRQIDEIKPAHLVFDTIGAVEPVVLENKNRLLFVSQGLRLRVSNLGESAIYLDGRRNLDGTWQLTQRFTRGAAFSRLLLSMGASNRGSCGQALAWAVRAMAHMRNTAGIASVQVCRYGANNLGLEETLLNGKRPLDGGWYLAASFSKGVGLSRFLLGYKATNGQDAHGGIHLRARAYSPCKGAVKAVYGAMGKNVQTARQQGFTTACGAVNAQRAAGSVTSRIDRGLDGAFYLDGVKKLNAGTIRSEL